MFYLIILSIWIFYAALCHYERGNYDNYFIYYCEIDFVKTFSESYIDKIFDKIFKLFFSIIEALIDASIID